MSPHVYVNLVFVKNQNKTKTKHIKSLNKLCAFMKSLTINKQSFIGVFCSQASLRSKINVLKKFFQTLFIKFVTITLY